MDQYFLFSYIVKHEYTNKKFDILLKIPVNKGADQTVRKRRMVSAIGLCMQ